MISNLASKDVSTAISIVHSLPEGEIRRNAVLALAEYLGPEDLAKTVSWLEKELPPNQLSEALSTVFQNSLYGNTLFSSQNLLKILDYIPAAQRPNLVQRLMSGLAQWDLDRALSMIPVLPDDNLRKPALESLMSFWVVYDPAAAAEYVLTLPVGETRKNLVPTIIQHWAHDSLREALEWTGKLTAEECAQVLPQFVGIMAEENPAEAAALLGRIPYNADQDPSEWSAALDKVLESWMKDDTKAAVQWVQDLPESQAKTDATQNLLNIWARKDLDTALGWTRRLPEGELRDNALDIVVNVMTERDASQAIQLATEIKDADTRTSAIKSAVYSWRNYDKTAADQWVKTSNLPDDVKKRLLETPDADKAAE